MGFRELHPERKDLTDLTTQNGDTISI
jgi:hypothetical protein